MALEGSYAFGDVGSSTIADLSGNGRDIDLSSTAGAQVSGGKQGGAFGKTGSGLVVLPSSLLAATQSDDRTVMFDALGVRTVWWVQWYKASIDSGVFGVFSLDGSDMRGRARRASDDANAPTPIGAATEVSNWRNYCLTYKRSTGLLTFYREGVQVAQTGFTSGTQLTNNATELNMGEFSSTGPAIDNLRFYSHALTDSEILALAGTEVTLTIIQKSSSEDMFSAEDASVSYALSSSDTAASVDVGQLAAVLSGAETSSGSDAENVAYALAGSDTSSSTDTGSLTVLGAVEAVSVAESGTLTASVLTDDSTSSSDQGILFASPSANDSVAAVDSGSPLASLAQEDEANTAESQSVAVIITSSESITVTDEEDVDNDQSQGTDEGHWLESSIIFPLVEADDVVQGCVKHLTTFPEVTAFLATFDDGEHFLFQYEMQGLLESTSKAAVVISRQGSWASPNPHNTAKFPRLSVEVWVDPLRDEERNAIEPVEVYRRAGYLLDQIDRHMHRPQGGDPQLWGTVRTIECARLGEPVIYRIPDGDAMLRGQVFYGVTVA